jgi:hypothetical protein
MMQIYRYSIGIAKLFFQKNKNIFLFCQRNKPTTSVLFISANIIDEIKEIKDKIRQKRDETVQRLLYLCSMKFIKNGAGLKVQRGVLRILALCIIFLPGCGPDEKALVQQKVDGRIAEFVKKRKEECRTGLLNEAEKIVDSLLLAEARIQLRDSLNQARPFKPVQPPVVLPIDSLEVKPIFKKGNN